MVQTQNRLPLTTLAMWCAMVSVGHGVDGVTDSSSSSSSSVLVDVPLHAVQQQIERPQETIAIANNTNNNDNNHTTTTTTTPSNTCQEEGVDMIQDECNATTTTTMTNTTTLVDSPSTSTNSSSSTSPPKMVDVGHNFTQCRDPRRRSMPIWGPSVFEFLQTTYRNVVGVEDSTIAPHSAKSGFQVPIVVKDSKHKGRGVYTLFDIDEGTRIWKNTQHATFRKEHDFLEFLSLLPFPLACDVLVWAYVEPCGGFHVEDGDCYVVAVELDEGSLVNSCKLDGSEYPDFGYCDDENEEWLECDPAKPDASYAFRDIEAGEEILIDYSAIDNDGEIEWFDALTDRFDHAYL